MKSQKRSSGRIKVIIDGKCRRLNDKNWEKCKINNLSSDGIAILGEKSFLAGDQIEIEFQLEKISISKLR